jgi:hypothetical protein
VDEGWDPGPTPRARWTAHELARAWDGAEGDAAALAFLVALTDREWHLIVRAAFGLPDAAGSHPSRLDREVCQEIVASLRGAGRPV